MKKILIILAIMLLISGCTYNYSTNDEQNNKIKNTSIGIIEEDIEIDNELEVTKPIEKTVIKPAAPVKPVVIQKQEVAPVIKKEPIKEVSKCDSNYSGCVPIASDVDCGGGSGNGPAYLYGTARVIGSDIYDLDRDNDGIACE